jgi:TPR repeat protein
MKTRWLLLSLLSALSLPACAAAQQIGAPSAAVQRGPQPIQESEQVRHGHHYVVAIGIDHYQNWPVLSTAVNDAVGFAKLLTSQFGFEYGAEPLTEKNATRDSIDSLIDDDLRAKLRPEDDLVIFFAGHGTTRNDKVGDQTQSVGFLVPYEARAPGQNEHWSDYINIEELLRVVSTLPSQHVLVILDSCHSGMALGARFTSNRADTRFQQDMLRAVSRKVISSAGGDQLAADTGPVTGHSLFTGILIQGLTSGKADAFGQGFITATQLGAYAQHEVGVAQGSRQTPLFGAFDLDAGGELIIPLGAGSTAAANPSAPESPTALTQLETSELEKIRQNDRRYWEQDSPLKNFPAARSAAIKLCNGGDGWACAQAANSYRFGLGGGTNYTLAVDYGRKGCTAGVVESCVIVGILYELGETIEPDPQNARQMYEQACNAGNLHGCADLGGLYYQGLSVPRDFARAAGLAQKACDGGELLGCEDLAQSYANGDGVTQDSAKALTLFQKACDGGDFGGCDGMAYMYVYGAVGVDRDPAKALTIFRKACDNGDMEGCDGQGLIYVNGVGVDKDLPQALDLFRRACAGQIMSACTHLGGMYWYGFGVGKDAAQATVLFRKGCDAGDMEGCDDLGIMDTSDQSGEKHTDEAATLFRKACAGGYDTACYSLVSMGADASGADVNFAVEKSRKNCDAGDSAACTMLGANYMNGLGVEKDLKQAEDLFQKGCKGDDIRSCADLGILYMNDTADREKVKQAITLNRDACNGGEMTGCASLAWMYLNGLGMKEDDAQAASYFGKACDGGNLLACTNLAAMYSNGRGVTADPTKAAALYRQACDGGEMGGCTGLAVDYQEGAGVTLDFDQASTLFHKACDGGNMLACNDLGMNYARGWGVTKDTAQAESFFRKACDAGNQNSCEELKNLK